MKKSNAMLTLPEEKKNTMEISEFKCMTCSTAITKGEYDTFGVCDACYDANHKKQTASGSAGNMTKEQEDELKQDIHAFTLVKALDLLDDCHHYLKANPPLKETMNYSKWENLVEETDYMREYNANAAYERANSASGSVAAPKEEGQPYFHLSKNEYGKMWLMYKPDGEGRYKCWEPITEEFWNEFEKLLR